jgi:hypothetical protein
MAFSGMLRRLALVRNDVSEELSSKFLRSVGSYKCHTANIPEDATLHNHRRENHKSYKVLGYLGISLQCLLEAQIFI